MPLKKILFKPGVNRENTRYTTEGGWYESNLVRFRQGTPEKIGGWQRISAHTFLGLCRSLWNWVTLGGLNLMGVGTNLKFYIEKGGVYNDITPLRTTVNPMLGAQPPGTGNPFTATLNSNVITVTDVSHGCATGDFVTFSGAVGLGGNITATLLNANHQVTVTSGDTYTITVSAQANATDVSGSPGGGAAVIAKYEIPVGPAYEVPLTGWGAGAWSSGTWGVGTSGTASMRLWSQSNFGEDLVFSQRQGAIYYWDATSGVTSRAVALTSLSGASDVPTVQNFVYVSDVSRFVIAFGANELGSGTQDPMLIRWSDQESLTNWTPAATNQAGGIRLSHGSEIVAAVQTRQEIVVLTDSAIYSMQYLGPPVVWGVQLLGDNVSIIGPNAAIAAGGAVYWMGVDKFYKYDGRLQTLRCDLRQFIYSDINLNQSQQIFCGTNDGFNEIWWFYCSAGSINVDKYVIYNYAEDIWYYGDLARTAWIDSGLRTVPVAATYSNNLVNHEDGVDNNETGTPQAISASIGSSETDIDDGHNFGFIWRLLPDITFRGSTGDLTPQVTMTLLPMQNSGSGVNNPTSRGGSDNAAVQRIAVATIEEFTGQVYIRVRGRQIIFKCESNRLGTQWQLGAPRIDIKPDGRRGNT
jgi:hypothetical protein